MSKEKILVVDDDRSTRETLEIFLNEIGFNVLLASDGNDGFEIYESEKPALVITDLKMPNIDGIKLLKMIKNSNTNIPVIIITAYDDMDTTIDAMKLRAYDYIEKPIDIAKLKFIIMRALETSMLSQKLENITSIYPAANDDNRKIIGKARAIKEIIKKVGQLSDNRVSILIQGESGTGKELLANVIHYSGITKEFPFIAVNSVALPETLLESELFGHTKGAFTGAIKEKKGKFELAGQGTIFLDEIADISLNLQTKLLRVLQEKEFARVGGEETIPMKARIIAATNKNLEELVRKEIFREDLFYRLNVFTINIPPLRERKEDIPDLVIHFLNKINKELHKNVIKIPYEVIDILQSYKWVGNVRELENTLMQAVVLAKGEVLERDCILLKMKSDNSNKEILTDLSLATLEKEHLEYVLNKVNWDKNEAAKLLKISRQTLYNKIKNYSIFPS